MFSYTNCKGEFDEKNRENHLHDVNDYTSYKFISVAECLGDNDETYIDVDRKFIPREGSKLAFNDSESKNSTNTNSTLESTCDDNSTGFGLQNDNAKYGAFDYVISNIVFSDSLLLYTVDMVF